jgi:glycosyltransferase involved in cell wall biosynthesis
MTTISVVIPLYNKVLHIERAIDSVLRQIYPALEICVIDDGSTDGSDHIVKKYKDSRIKLVRQENKGAGAARNRSISMARGELVAFLDADDSWKPQYLAKIHELRQRYPQAGIYATAFKIVLPDGNKSFPKFKVLPRSCSFGLIEDFFKVAIPHHPICTSAITVPKNILEEIGGFPEGEISCQDIDTWIRIGVRYSIAWYAERLATYHRDAKNRIFRIYKFTDEACFSKTGRKLIRLGLIPEHKMKSFREYLAFWQYYNVRHLISGGRMPLARKILKESFGTKMFIKMGWVHYIFTFLPPVFFVKSRLYYKYCIELRNRAINLCKALSINLI